MLSWDEHERSFYKLGGQVLLLDALQDMKGLFHSSDKILFSINKSRYFSYFSMKTWFDASK